MNNEMKIQDLVELYQLIVLYEVTYKSDFRELKNDIAERYFKVSGKNIKDTRNPRGAGRRNIYDEEYNNRILELRSSGWSMRKIAKEIGCSIGHVQNVIKNSSV